MRFAGCLKRAGAIRRSAGKRSEALGRKKIVVIEDEADILGVLDYNLSRAGFDVVRCRDGLDGLEKVRRESADLVVLDLMLPGLDGIEVCRRLKSDPLTGGIPVIMATAKGEESDAVLGLGVGADDYVRKPFSTRELIARVKAVLRRGGQGATEGAGSRIVVGDLVIDPARHQVFVGGEEVAFTLTEFKLLSTLASSPGRVFRRDELLDRVAGDDVHLIDRNIDVHVLAVRRKLGERRGLVETVRGVGYRFRHARG